MADRDADVAGANGSADVKWMRAHSTRYDVTFATMTWKFSLFFGMIKPT